MKELIDRRIQQRLQQLSRPTAGKPSQEPAMQPERVESSGIGAEQVKPEVIPSRSGGTAPVAHDGRPAQVEVSPEQSQSGQEKPTKPNPASLEEPDYVLADREFAEAELAGGQSLDDPRLVFWREQLTRDDTPFLRSDIGEIAVLIDDDPLWVEAVERTVRNSLEDDQVIRYLGLMVPLLPPASRYDERTACFAIQPSLEDDFDERRRLHEMAKRMDRSAGI